MKRTRSAAVSGSLMALFFGALFLGTTSQAATSTAEKKPDSIQDVMHSFAKELETMRVFSSRSEGLKERPSDEQVERQLKDLNTRVQALKPEDLPGSARAYRITLKALKQHIGETERMYRVGNKEYARWMLNATTSLCIMCHTQLSESTKLQSFWTYKPTLSTVHDSFQGAEFLFVTRRFFQAMPIYDSLIQEFPGNKLNTVDLDTSLRRKVSYFARIKRDPKAAVKSLEKDLENKKLPIAVKQNAEAWAALFRKWSKEKKDPDILKASSREVLDFTKKQFDKTLWDKMIEANDPRVVTHLRVSGILYEFLFTHPSDENTPELLLWLGRSETYLNNQFFYSLGDLYLRECVNEFPAKPAAKECFAELEKSLTEAYRTTTGLHFPPEIEAELEGYRQKIGIKK